MSSNKKVVVKDITAKSCVQIDNATTLSFYIVERTQDTPITSIDYQVEKISGRTSEVLTTWTGVSLAYVEDDIYEFDYTVTGVTTSDKILLRFKVVDADGLEYFVDLNDIEIVA